MRSRDHRVVANGTKVAAVVHHDHADADLLGFFHSQPHGLGANDHAETAFGVDHGGARRFPLDGPTGGRVELAGPVVLDIEAQHVGHAMGFHRAQIRHGEHVCGFGGVFRTDPELGEDGRDSVPQCIFRHLYFLALGYFKSIQNHGWHSPVFGSSFSRQSRLIYVSSCIADALSTIRS